MQFGSNIFDRIIRKYLFIKGFIAEPLIDKQRCINLIKTLQPWDTGLELIRLGPNKDGGYTKKAGDNIILIPTINKKLVTPYCESFHSVVWHCLVSHPILQKKKMKW